LSRRAVKERDNEDRPRLGVFGLPFRTLLSREVRRFMKVWTQTLLAPLFTSALSFLGTVDLIRRGYKLRY
jgi:hypothetical protein